MSFTRFSSLLCCALMFSGVATAQAQADWPARPITIIVPFTPGGSTDAIARLVAQKLGEKLNKSVVVENIGGGGGTIGTAKAGQAAPDGYTLVLGVDSPIAIARLINPAAVKYKSQDFSPIGLISTAPMVLMARPDLPANNITELLALARAEPGKLTYATSGIGTVLHLAMETIKQQGKVDLLHVPYRGGSQVMTDLMGGQIDLAMLASGSAIPPILGKKVKGIVITDDKRLQALPDVPALAETPEFKGFKMIAWTGLFAPAGTPPAILTRLNHELNEVLQSADVQTQLAQQGVIPGTGSAEEFGAFVKSEETRYERIVKSANIAE